MQTVHTTTATKITHGGTWQKASRHDKPRRGALALACAPLAALSLFSGASWVQTRNNQKADTVRFGRLSRQDALHTAPRRLATLLGVAAGSLTAEDAFPQAGGLRRAKLGAQGSTRSWQVVLRSAQAQYIVSLNADTGRLYRFNRLDADSPAGDSSTGEGSRLLSRIEGEMRARQCLKRVGVAPDELTASGGRGMHSPENGSDIPVWNFQYRRPVRGLGQRTVVVCINRQTGVPDTFWNPTGAFTAL